MSDTAMEVVRLLEKCGLAPFLAARVLLYTQHPLLRAVLAGGGQWLDHLRHRSSSVDRWCSICGEHSALLPLFRCTKTLRPLCETCLMEERCFDCYH